MPSFFGQKNIAIVADTVKSYFLKILEKVKVHERITNHSF
jgi:hypothetical protein